MEQSGDITLELTEAVFRLTALLFFQESAFDRELYLQSERLAQSFVGHGNRKAVEQSELAAAISQRMAKKLGQITVAGIVANIFFGIHCAGESPTLNGIARLVSEFVLKHPNHYYYKWSDQKQVAAPSPMPSSVTDISRAFRAYWSVAGLCATRVTYSFHLPPEQIGRTMGNDEKAAFLKSTATMQIALSKIAGTDKWRMFDMNDYLPSSAFNAQILGPTNDFFAEILEPSRGLGLFPEFFVSVFSSEAN
jgi:hypothetical protein